MEGLTVNKIQQMYNTLICDGKKQEALEYIVQENQLLLWEEKLEGFVKAAVNLDLENDLQQGLVILLKAIHEHDQRFNQKIRNYNILLKLQQATEPLSGTGLPQVVLFDYLGLIHRNVYFELLNGPHNNEIAYKSKAEFHADSAIKLFSKGIDLCEQAIKHNIINISERDASIWKGYLLPNRGRFTNNLTDLVDGAAIRERNAILYQDTYADGKKHLDAEYGYSCIMICTMLMDAYKNGLYVNYYNRFRDNAELYLGQRAKDHPLAEQLDIFKKKESEALNS